MTPSQMEQRMAVSLEHLIRYHEDDNDFLFRILTRDESWVLHFTPERKVKSMERKIPSSPVRCYSVCKALDFSWGCFLKLIKRYDKCPNVLGVYVEK
ncbi:histone-lysine N-methyltransferase SETMAR [Trichonephila clavipes]|nr:histone-lysine N-methyltransferase SETMAR [Trichonephila clavipes]